VVDRHAVVEAAFVVEVDYLLNGVRGLLLADVAEGTTVTKGCERARVMTIQSEEAANTQSEEALALGEGVLATRTVDERLRKQDPRIGSW
jgi:hypothetical protein